MTETPLLGRLRLARDAAAGGPSPAWHKFCDTAYRDAVMAIEQPERAIAVSFQVPPEIPAALGLCPIAHELVSAAAAVPASRSALAAAAVDVAPGATTCEYQRMLWGLVAAGWIVNPRAFVATTLPCDDAWKMYEVAAARLHRPFFLIEAPGTPARPAGEAAVRSYVARQLAACAQRLGRVTGTRLTAGGVARAVEFSNRALAAHRRVDRLRQERPGILPAPRALRYFTLNARLGTLEAAQTLEALTNELTAPAPRGPAGALAPGAPRKRLLWVGVLPPFLPAVTADLEERYAVTVVYEESSAFEGAPLSAKSFFSDLAARTLAQHCCGPAARRAATLMRLARRFSADGVVQFSYPRCQAPLGSGAFIAAACKRMGIPFTEVTVELIDPSPYGAGRVGAQLEAFMPRVGARQKPRDAAG